jgi:hypothetical protein
MIVARKMVRLIKKMIEKNVIFESLVYTIKVSDSRNLA